MGTQKILCDYCGREIYRYPSQIKKHNFCSRQCLASYSNKTKNPEHYTELKSLAAVSKHMSELNRELNPKRMTSETRAKLRNAHLRDDAKSYPKLYGVHEHRLVAEKKIGRKLKPGEVVHHIDRNKRNNAPDNLMIFSSQAEHAAWHKVHDGGDAE